MSEEKESGHNWGINVNPNGNTARVTNIVEEAKDEIKHQNSEILRLCKVVAEYQKINDDLESRLKEAEKKRCQCGEKYRCPIHECQDALYRQIHYLEGLLSKDTSTKRRHQNDKS